MAHEFLHHFGVVSQIIKEGTKFWNEPLIRAMGMIFVVRFIFMTILNSQSCRVLFKIRNPRKTADIPRLLFSGIPILR